MTARTKKGLHTVKTPSDKEGIGFTDNRRNFRPNEINGLPSVDTLNTVEAPCAIPRMPSILEMGKLIRAICDAHHRADEEETALHNTQGTAAQSSVLTRIKELASDREDALTDLAMCLPAVSVGDAAVHIVMAKSLAEDLENNDYEDFYKYQKLRQLNRLLASAMPIVAEAAGVSVMEIGGEWMAGVKERLFPELGGGL
ncbi:hypothetical protein [Acidisoma cladoniae]|uniref:hypothetical protein n=1 Tax=Acidisoma cladoniae TaxID=3040935 RepID=UPI00254AC73B|nr:hypothetical protein [Acidisoma sp. PAMC 29798]